MQCTARRSGRFWANNVLARVLAQPLWTPSSWQAWCLELVTQDTIRKAELVGPLKRADEVRRIAAVAAGKPIAARGKPLLRRRTAYSLNRVDSLVRAGKR